MTWIRQRRQSTGALAWMTRKSDESELLDEDHLDHLMSSCTLWAVKVQYRPYGNLATIFVVGSNKKDDAALFAAAKAAARSWGAFKASPETVRREIRKGAYVGLGVDHHTSGWEFAYIDAKPVLQVDGMVTETAEQLCDNSTNMG